MAAEHRADTLRIGTLSPALGAAAAMAGAERVGPLLDTMMGRSLHWNVAAAEREVGAVCTPDTTVNLAGWSRGAVTCIGIANALATRGVRRINLFLFDPVPGPKSLNHRNWREHLTTLPDAVRSAVILLMEQEEGGLMTMKELLLEPLTTSFAGGTAAVYPMPGRHNTAVENDAQYPEIATLGEHLCRSFLLANGTKLAAAPALGDAAVVELYAAVKRRMRKQSAGAGYTDRSFAVDNPLRASLFFVNRHHQEAFARAFPVLAQILDPSFQVTRWSAAAQEEAGRLRSRASEMRAVLAAGLGTLIASRAPALGAGRPRRDAGDLVRLLGALNGWTPDELKAALGVVNAPPQPLFASPLLSPGFGPTISAGRSSSW
jgi:hypothetical protein